MRKDLEGLWDQAWHYDVDKDLVSALADLRADSTFPH